MSLLGLPMSTRIYSMQAVVALLLSLFVGCKAVQEQIKETSEVAALSRDAGIAFEANPKRNLVRREDLNAMRAGGRDVEVVTRGLGNYAATQPCPKSGVPGTGNAHPNAWHAVEAQIRNPRVLEIARRVPWGFYELGGRRINMEIHSFLNTSDFATHGLTESKASITVILHILVGEGESRENWQRAVQKAIQMAGQVLILEHNGKSTDRFGPPSGPKEKFFKPSEMLQALRNMNVPTPYVCFIPGDGEARNVLVSIAS